MMIFMVSSVMSCSSSTSKEEFVSYVGTPIATSIHKQSNCMTTGFFASSGLQTHKGNILNTIVLCSLIKPGSKQGSCPCSCYKVKIVQSLQTATQIIMSITDHHYMQKGIQCQHRWDSKSICFCSGKFCSESAVR